jgi:hypothetical protein
MRSARISWDPLLDYFTFIGHAPDLISEMSITTYFYVYLAGDYIWDMRWVGLLRVALLGQQVNYFSASMA